MNELWIQVTSGLIVALIAGVIAYLFKRKNKRFRKFIHLNKLRYIYWLSYVGASDKEPVWMHGESKLIVTRDKDVQGTGRTTKHPHKIEWVYTGEIQSERMLLKSSETDLSSEYYPLLVHAPVIGVWIGLDNANLPITAPIIRSIDPLNDDQLNDCVRKSTIRIVPPGNYHSYGG